MSNFFINSGGGGGGSNIQTIAGDTGSITGNNVTIFANQATLNSGSSVAFNNVGTVSTLSVTDSLNNTMIGRGAGTASVSQTNNTGLGLNVGASLTSGQFNVFIGANAGDSVSTASQNVIVGSSAGDTLTTGNLNTIVGYDALSNMITGANNIAIGHGAGSNCVSSESSNILINNVGVGAENNTIRIGVSGSSPGQQNRNFQAGITGVTVAASAPIAVDTNGQLSSLGFGTAAQVLTSNGAGVSPTWQSSGGGSATAFRARLNAQTADTFTGDGTFVTVPIDTVDYDTASAFNTGTFQYTIPTTGFWQINYTVYPFRFGGVNTVCFLLLNVNSGGNLVRSFEVNYENCQTNGELTLTSGMQNLFTAGDTLEVTCAVGGVTKNIGFGGSETCVFSGFLLG